VIGDGCWVKENRGYKLEDRFSDFRIFEFSEVWNLEFLILEFLLMFEFGIFNIGISSYVGIWNF